MYIFYYMDFEISTVSKANSGKFELIYAEDVVKYKFDKVDVSYAAGGSYS